MHVEESNKFILSDVPVISKRSYSSADGFHYYYYCYIWYQIDSTCKRLGVYNNKTGFWKSAARHSWIFEALVHCRTERIQQFNIFYIFINRNQITANVRDVLVSFPTSIPPFMNISHTVHVNYVNRNGKQQETGRVCFSSLFVLLHHGFYQIAFNSLLQFCYCSHLEEVGSVQNCGDIHHIDAWDFSFRGPPPLPHCL